MFYQFVSIISLSLVLFYGQSYQQPNNPTTDKRIDIQNLALTHLNITELEGTWSIIYTKAKRDQLNPCLYTVIKAGHGHVNVTNPMFDNTLVQRLEQNTYLKGRFEDTIYYNEQTIGSTVFVLQVKPYLVIYQYFNNNKPEFWAVLKRRTDSQTGDKPNITEALKVLIEAGIAKPGDPTIGRYCEALNQ